VRLVILVIAAAVAAAAVGVRRRGPRYAYGRWSEPDAVVPRVGAIFDGP